jgi:hypothetical protein
VPNKYINNKRCSQSRGQLTTNAVNRRRNRNGRRVGRNPWNSSKFLFCDIFFTPACKVQYNCSACHFRSSNILIYTNLIFLLLLWCYANPDLINDFANNPPSEKENNVLSVFAIGSSFTTCGYFFPYV